MNSYDVIILGGGTGGYVAAIRASQLGLNVAIIEKAKLGGTCLHAGCIPSKALLRSAEVFHTAKKADEFGVITSDVTVDFSKVIARKNAIVAGLEKGIHHLMKVGKITVIEGVGTISKMTDDADFPVAIAVKLNDGTGTEVITAKRCVIATGSRPRSLPGLVADGQYVLTSDEALHMESLPKSMIIVGGGVIGIEWASLLADFGIEVTVLEYADRIIPTEDHEISKEMQRSLKKRRVKVITSAKVLPETYKLADDSVAISAEVKGNMKTYTAEKLLVSVGRLANTENIGLENTSVEIERGMIKTNPYCQTNDAHFYAIGDVIGGLQLAHVAAHEAILAIEHLSEHQVQPIDTALVPKCIYGRPECASVGLSEAEAIEKGYQIKVGKFFFKAIGKALVFGESDGFVKLIKDADTNQLLGVHMIGPHVTDLITEAGMAMLLKATDWDVGRLIHPHPSLSEIMGEAALAIDGLAING